MMEWISGMSETEDFLEQRKHKRFRAQDGTYAILKGPGKKLGQVINISIGGLAFRYIDIGERPKKSYQLDIFLTENSFRLEKLNFKTISDFEVDDEFNFSSIPMRRRGVQFEELEQNQLDQIEHFIQKHTVSNV